MGPERVAGFSAASGTNIFSFQVLTKKKLQDLVREIDPNEQLDEDVEEVRSCCSSPVLVPWSSGAKTCSQPWTGLSFATFL